LIKIVEFKQWMEAISKLREPSPETAQEFSSNIDYVVADTPFAQAAQLTYQGELAYKEFSANDFPQGTPQSEYEEWYALAVRAGEPKLIGNINDVLKNLHEQGRLQVLKQDSNRSFEKSIGKKEP